jgi:hypothetical protein
MGTFLTSTVVAALVGSFVAALFSLLTSERRIAAENVIQERKNWRDKIRALSSEVFEALLRLDGDDRENTLRSLRAKFSLLLNPHDAMDQAILTLIAQDSRERAEEFTQRVGLLLKHDWERAKREASLWRRLCEKEPRRVTFEVFRPGAAHAYREGRWC